jgi:hypothetical protein
MKAKQVSRNLQRLPNPSGEFATTLATNFGRFEAH